MGPEILTRIWPRLFGIYFISTCYVLDMVLDTGYNQEWGVVFGHSGEIHSPKVEADPCIET